MTTSYLSVGIAALVVCCHAIAQPPSQSRPPRLLNHRNIGEQPHHLIINAAPRRDGSYRFTVIVRAKDLPLEGGSGYLTIQDGDKLVCECQLKAEADKSSVQFEFDVASPYIVKSRFSLLIYTADAEERKKLTSVGGWTSYQFTLKDFVAADATTTKSPNQ